MSKLAVSKSADGIALQKKDMETNKTIVDAYHNNTVVAEGNAAMETLKNQKINDAMLNASHAGYLHSMYNDTVQSYNDMNAVANQKAIDAAKNQKINDARLLAAYNEGLGYMVDSTGKYYGLMLQEANAKMSQ